MNRWTGKLLGLVAGWLLLRHPAGGLLGLLLGHAWDAGWLGPRAPSPYEALGLAADATDAEVDQAYRRLMSRHHPDKVAGEPPEQRAQAERRTREINAAYDRIRRQRKR